MRLTIGGVTGAPRLIAFAGDQLFISPLDILGLGILHEMLSDAFPDQEPIKFGAPECRQYIATVGIPTLLWAVHGRFHDWAYATAVQVTANATDQEKADLLAAAFRKRPRLKSSGDKGSDLGVTDWGWIAYHFLDVHSIAPDAFRHLTIDQIENILMTGKPFEGEDADVSLQEAQRMWEEAQAAGDEPNDAGQGFRSIVNNIPNLLTAFGVEPNGQPQTIRLPESGPSESGEGSGGEREGGSDLASESCQGADISGRDNKGCDVQQEDRQETQTNEVGL